VKRWAIVALFVAGSITVHAASPAPPIRAESILEDVNTRGPQPVVAALRSDSNQWDQVMTNISHGNPHWLNVAAALRPGTDAGSSEALNEAVFLALKPAPTRVLQLLKDGTFETAAVCNSNIATDYPDAQSQKFIKERIAALQGVSDQNTLAVRDRCLAGLRAALAEFDNSNDRSKSP
jgi:hypothetical protein